MPYLVMQSSKPGTTIPINNVLISSTKSSHSSVFSLVKENRKKYSQIKVVWLLGGKSRVMIILLLALV